MTSAPTLPIEVPPYQLQSLIQGVIEQDGYGSSPPKRSSRDLTPSVHVSCAQALGSEIYVGCSNGMLLRFALQADNPNAPESYRLISRQSLPEEKSVDELALVPSISRLLVLSNHQVHFYTLPALDPVPPNIIKPIRNVVTFAVDDQHMRRLPPSLSDPYVQVEPIDFCVIKRTAIMMYTLQERLFFRKEIPLPQGATMARRTGNYLCVADRENYNMIDLEAASLFPLIPLSQAPDASIRVKPSITVINHHEFLLLSWTGTTTMGLFITGNGDPVRGTLEWPSHPKALCLDYPYVVALLSNNTIEIHSVETQTIAQVISPPLSPSSRLVTDPRALIATLNGYLVPSTERTDRLRPIAVSLLSADNGDATVDASTIPPGSNLLPSAVRPPLFPRSGVLVLGSNAIDSLVPSTLISQAEALLDGHRIEETVDLADQQRKKLQASLVVDDDKADELRYVYQRIGFQCLKETLFEDAGKHLFAGDLDPRLLVHYFPDLRGSLFTLSDSVGVFAGVKEHMPEADSIDDIVMNYSPHLSPNTRSAPPTAELRKVLGMAAREMLEVYLRRWRTRRRVDDSFGGPHASDINPVVDTVLVKIFAESEKTADLTTLIDESGDIILSDVESVLASSGQYSALCKLYQKRGDEAKLLEAWSKVVEGVWTDKDIPDPLNNIISLLGQTRDRELVQQWGLWVTKIDPERGMKLLISRDSKRGGKGDDVAMLEQIRSANPVAGSQFLEYLVLQKRSADPNLHEQLATACVDQLLECLTDETVSKLWRAKAASYVSSRNDSPFLSYFASTTPDSDSKRIRLKTSLFLQGSNLYDAAFIRERLFQHEKIFKLELAIIDGKLGRHREALTTLAHDLRDSVSAEAYCTLGGDVISGKLAQSIGQSNDLQAWAALFDGSGKTRQKTADEGVKTQLLRILLEVYMTGGEATADRTARLLNSQAMNLDVLDVITLVPPDWSLSVMSSFLARSFRRTLHQRHEGQILKAISAGQNLEVAERTWLVLREQGAILEEAVEGDDGDDVVDEKSLTEKIGLGVDGDGDGVLPARVTEIDVQARKEGLEDGLQPEARDVTLDGS